MKFLRKNWLMITYGLLCVLVVAGMLIGQEASTLIHVSFLPYLVIAPGFMYFSYQRTGRLGKLLPLCFTMLLFLLPLTAIWLDTRSTGNILAGFLPYNDASDYYTDALGLLDGQLFDGISVRRPIFTAFLSFLFAVTARNLLLTLVILVLINAVSCYLLARQVHNLWGSAAAVTVTVLLFFFYRRFAGTTLTENIGLALGSTGSALLLMGAQKTDRKIVLFGIVLLSLGMNARAGALLVLPVIVLWGSWLFREKAHFSASFLALGIIAVSVGFLFNWGTGKLVVDPEIAASKTGMFANYSNTFYGIAAGGKGWAYIYDAYPELRAATNKEALIYEYAFDLIRQNPFSFVKGMANSFVDFFSPRYGAFSFLYASTSDPCTMENFAQSLGTCQMNFASTGNETKIACMASTLSARIIDITASLVMALFLLIPFCWGAVVCYRKREQPWRSLLLAIILGILLSVPLVPPRDASKMRAFAVTQPLMMAVAAVGLVEMAQFFSQKTKLRSILNFKDKESAEPELPPAHGLVIFSLILSLFIILSPVSAKWFAHDPQVTQVTCPAELESRSFRINPGSALELVQENAVSITWSGISAPIQHYSSNLEAFCVLTDAEAAAIEDLLQVHSGQVLIKPVFLGGENDAQLAVLSKDEVPLQAGYISVCGETRDGIFYSQVAPH